MFRVAPVETIILVSPKVSIVAAVLVAVVAAPIVILSIGAKLLVLSTAPGSVVTYTFDILVSPLRSSVV